jgi:glycosyltransferase involved in cell wall biosynthesis
MTEATDDEALNVLLLAEDFYPKESGGAFIDWNVATYLVEHGDSVTTVTPRYGDTARKEIINGVEILRPFRGHSNDKHPNSIRGFLRRIVFTLVLIPFLLVLCWRQDFDLIYSTNHLLHPPAAIATFVERVPHISFIGYSPSIREENSLLDPLVVLERVNFRLFIGDLVICQTPSVKQMISREYGREVERIDGAVDTEAILEAVNSPSRQNTTQDPDPSIELIFTGRLVSIKNPGKLPEIISDLPPEYTLTIVGGGPRKSDIEDTVEDLNLQDRITLTGKLPHRETLQKIYSSGVLLLPSTADAYPTVVFEALCLNTPVLATPVGVLPTIDHRNLTTAPLGEFSNYVSGIETAGRQGIDEETLRQFSVERFAISVREHMVEVMGRSPQPDS